MSARELCRQWGVSTRMYEEFLKPTLLVGLFAPPEEVREAACVLPSCATCCTAGMAAAGVRLASRP
jgi:hypothetical protein